jgi:HlyD family secretion protein
VPQETFLFDGTVRDNIIFGRPLSESSGAKVERAVALAGVEEFLPFLANGLDTMVGERGVRLSGGQRQRLGIARALYGSPQVLVLDEATSALDGVMEAAITETLRGLHGVLTVLIVAHRLSTVSHCDRLLLFDRGHLRNTGTFGELQSKDALFADLVAHGSLT